MNTVKINIEVD